MDEKIANLQRQIDELRNPTIISDIFINTLIQNGFLHHEKELRYTSDALIEYIDVFIKIRDNIYLFNARPDAYLREFTASTSNVITSNLHGLSDDMQVLVKSTGALPSPLIENNPYYIIDATENTFKLSSSAGGAEINITDSGVGVHYWEYFT